MALIDTDPNRALDAVGPVIGAFPSKFHDAWNTMMARKLGLITSEEADADLISDLLELMQAERLDYTLSFDALTESVGHADAPTPPALATWMERWRRRIAAQDPTETQALMRQHNPVVIPRNHHMEAVIQAAVESDDFRPAEAFLDVLKRPYIRTAATAQYADAPEDGDKNYQTFCGT